MAQWLGLGFATALALGSVMIEELRACSPQGAAKKTTTTTTKKTGKAKCGLKDYVLSNRESLKVFKRVTDLAILCFRKLI